MCYISTPIHSCTHIGRSLVTSACACAPSSLQSCGDTVDMGCQNVSYPCSSCSNPSSTGIALGMKGVQGTTMMGMLNAIDAARTRATTSSGTTPASSGTGSRRSSVADALAVSEEPSTEVSQPGSETEAEYCGVPDLGYLGELGAVKPPPSASAQIVNMHWRAFAAGLQK